MRMRRAGLVLLLLGMAVCAVLGFVTGRPSGKPAVSVSVLGWTNHNGFVWAKVRLNNVGSCSVSYESTGMGPSGWLKTESSDGWSTGALGALQAAVQSCFGPALMSFSSS